MNFLEILIVIIKMGIGLSILNVWLINRDKSTPWRGGKATSMQEEFAAYGLNKTTMIIVGTLKSIFAVLLFVSIFYTSLTIIGAGGIAILMAGAIAMHFKINDPIKKSIPAAIFLVLSLVLLYI
jgi:hypothetical protein